MSNCCAKSPLQFAMPLAKSAQEPSAPERPKRQVFRWRELLSLLAGPAVRLHRYRRLRNAMLYDLLSCGPGRESRLQTRSKSKAQ